jgi:hypothetical protein
MTDNLIDLKIKPEFFNTKFLFYNYYQFNKQKKIPINYRTPYCVLDGIYIDTIELKINKIIKRKNNNKFVILFTITENNNIIKLLKTINEFNKTFFKNIKLSSNYKKKRTLKNSASNGIFQKIASNSNYQHQIENRYSDNSNDNSDDNVYETDDDYDTNNTDNNTDNVFEDKSNSDKYNRENTRFNNIDAFITKNRNHTYTDFIKKYEDKYTIECEIKPEYCQKLFYKLRTSFNFSNLSGNGLNSNNSKKKELEKRISICNEIIKLGNSEYFKFNAAEREWNCSEWNIALNFNIKSNIFEINHNDDLEMIWKICSFTF